jgi:membrane associated rhomboid family serine protease
VEPTFPPAAAWIELARSSDRRLIRQEGLALHAVGIDSAVLEQRGEQVLLVRAPDAPRATEELARYRAENRNWPPRETVPAPISEGVHAALVYVGLLALAFHIQFAQRFGVDWLAAGRADAAAIRAGEWWRAVTALTLHSDLPHVAGNALSGAVLGVIVAQSVGLGLAGWGFLVAGALGNWLNAWLQDASHRSIGASTAVFGLLGLQAAYEWMRRADLGYKRWRRWIPLVMGIALLAWLGAGGAYAPDPTSIDGLERIDVGAHALGFVVGAALGLGLGFVPRRALRLAPARQAWIACGAVLAIGAAWAIALAAR